ncbi:MULTISPECIES: acyl carrier protein [unclassified Streptomyces]|uniref:acyl carrier protein n=1 Tax=unclassified Streptomyces TaxID=2593676 RepID=UPI00369CDB50
MPSLPDVDSLTRLCAEVIGVPSVAPESSFYEAGGDSIGAFRLAVLLRSRWGVDADTFMIMATESLLDVHAELVARLGDDSEAAS